MPDQDDTKSREGVRPVRVCAIVEEHDDRQDECTLYPISVSSKDERLTWWITARGDAFVDRGEVR